jgi:hypothetical protein
MHQGRRAPNSSFVVRSLASSISRSSLLRRKPLVNGCAAILTLKHSVFFARRSRLTVKFWSSYIVHWRPNKDTGDSELSPIPPRRLFFQDRISLNPFPSFSCVSWREVMNANQRLSLSHLADLLVSPPRPGCQRNRQAKGDHYYFWRGGPRRRNILS